MKYELSETQLKEQINIVVLDCMAAIESGMDYNDFLPKITSDTLRSLNVIMQRGQNPEYNEKNIGDLAGESFSVQCIKRDPVRYFGMMSSRSSLLGLSPSRVELGREIEMDGIGWVSSFAAHDPQDAFCAVAQAICEGMRVTNIELYKMKDDEAGTQWRVFGVFYLSVGDGDDPHVEKFMTPAGTTFSDNSGRHTKEIQEFSLWLGNHYSVEVQWKDYAVQEFNRQVFRT